MMTIHSVAENALAAFQSYKKTSPVQRAAFLEAIGTELEAQREVLVNIAHQESNLPLARLNGELHRTINQAKLFANLLKEGSWVEATIDTEDLQRVPAKPDTRKMLVPIGPVVVFGASNFPFAFSTAGGDTVSALASGSTVIVKGHSAHAQTSSQVFTAVEKAILSTGMPSHTVQHLLGSGRTVGKELVTHPYVTGVGFTGSFSGGKSLVEYSQQRESPIPVFAEMSSINPVVLFPDTLEKNAAELAKNYAGSITLGAGQFCTNPGILLALQSDALNNFLSLLQGEITKVAPQKMLHTGIYDSYLGSLEKVLSKKGLQVVGKSATAANTGEAAALVASVSGEEFLSNPHFAEEVFGPYSLCVICKDRQQLADILRSLKGQLTTTIMATATDLQAYAELIELQQSLAGRIILNNVPTGVEVNASMVHGGPYPATTDARFTSVGSSAIKRWVRPLCLQNFTDAMLPDALKNGNPLNIWRTVNNGLTKDKIAFG